jgi:ankyrin repeat protein
MEEYINRDILNRELIDDNICGLLYKIDPNNFIIELSKKKINNKLIIYLINKNFNINYIDPELNVNVLFYTIPNYNYELMSILIHNNINLNLCDIYNNTSLHYAIMINNFRIVKLLLKNKTININHISINDNTNNYNLINSTYLIHSIITAKNIKITKLLLNNNADVNKNVDYSALYYSIINYLFNITFLLLNNKNIKINNDEILLIFSDKILINNISTRLFYNLIKLLINKGFNINYANNYGQTILHQICEIPDLGKNDMIYDKIKILLDFGSNVNSLDSMNQTPLFYAGKNLNVNIIILLLKYNTNFKINNYQNKSFLDVFMYSYQLFKPYEYLTIDYFNDIYNIINRMKIETNWINRKNFVTFLHFFNKNTKNILCYTDKVLTCESLYMYITSFL